jgi:hypothetical protein
MIRSRSAGRLPAAGREQFLGGDIMNKTKTQPQRLKHFTTIPALIGILESGALRLSASTDLWEDKNDLAAVNAYKRKTGAGQVRVLCFASGDEQIHHWFHYAGKDSGCCIHFKTDALLALLRKENTFLKDSIDYKSAGDLSAAWLKDQPVEKIPFIKRRPWELEQEYRVIWKGSAEQQAPSIPITGLIDYITLAPGLAGRKGDGLRQMLESKYTITVKQSRLLEDKEWIARFQR